MKKILFVTVGLFVLGFITACKQDVAAVIEPEQTLIMEHYDRGRPIRTKVVEKESPEYRALLNWAKSNTSGWSSSPVTYAPVMLIRGTNFSLNIQKNRAIFVSKHGQYTKTISSEEHEWFVSLFGT